MIGYTDGFDDGKGGGGDGWWKKAKAHRGADIYTQKSELVCILLQ